MNEARKKKAKEGAKEEFISEEVEKQRKKNELELQVIFWFNYWLHFSDLF